MKILVVDDNEDHRKAAEVFLKGHDLTVLASFDEARSLLLRPHDFEVALLDLMLPASDRNQASKKHVGQEMPLGTTLAFLALKSGIKRVAVVTDTNHHEHPASAAFDGFSAPFSIGDARVMLTNRDCMVMLDKKVVKDWAGVLEKLNT